METLAIISYGIQELVSIISFICACKVITWTRVLCLPCLCEWRSARTGLLSLENCGFLSLGWLASVLFSVWMAGLIACHGSNSGSSACTVSGRYLDPGTSFPWCSRALAALKSESPKMVCWTVASCMAVPDAAASQPSARQAFSSNNIPFDPVCQACYRPVKSYIITASKSAQQQQPGRVMATFRLQNTRK